MVQLSWPHKVQGFEHIVKRSAPARMLVAVEVISFSSKYAGHFPA
jgi:hypothetical protein